ALHAKELSPRMLAEYTATIDRLVATFGKSRLISELTAEDFESLRAKLADQYGPVRLGNEIQKIRTVFKYAYESGLIDRPVRFGPQFAKPSKAVMRKHRATMGKRLFSATEVRLLLNGGKLVDESGKPIKDDKGKPKKIGPASSSLRAMILLGV